MARYPLISGLATDNKRYGFRAKESAYKGLESNLGFTITAATADVPSGVTPCEDNKARTRFPRVRLTLKNGKTKVIFIAVNKVSAINQLVGKSVSGSTVTRATIVNN
jgi:hypothetical protein